MKALLKEKTKLTGDVFKLIFGLEQNPSSKAGQFIMFILPSGLRRAYSIAFQDGENFEFIIKRLENGRGGSKEICDLEVGANIEYMGPLGHFVLQETQENKLFIGTGTGFAPLYFQIKKALSLGIKSKLMFIFGVRYKSDIFYETELDLIKKEYPNFDYKLYLSKAKKNGTITGYVTDFLIKDNIDNYSEFYICGSPAMVEDARNKLESSDVNKEKIYFEKY